jgi:ArsR family transcriptional regulator, arsenate/arsenite/antimonite-responsive transcriptional repressor
LFCQRNRNFREFAYDPVHHPRIAIEPPMTSSTVLQSTCVEAGFKALGDPLRLQIVTLLQSQEICVCDLCDRLQIGQSKISFHLKVLKEAQLLRARQEGKWIYYSLNLPQFLELEQYLTQFRQLSPMRPSRVCEPDELGHEN